MYFPVVKFSHKNIGLWLHINLDSPSKPLLLYVLISCIVLGTAFNVVYIFFTPLQMEEPFACSIIQVIPL